MEERQFPNGRPVNPRRRRRTKMQIFKEAYLPVIIAGAALVMILVFIIGSITRAVQRSQLAKKESIAASIAAVEEQQRLDREATTIGSEASALAVTFDYEGAIALLDSFSGNIADYPELAAKRQEYEKAADELVLWNDPSKIVNLSFQMLVADPQRAFDTQKQGNAYKSYVTVDEFSKILQELYENDYILIGLDDITNGTQAKELYLPADRKPLLLTQLQVNYYAYMTDSDGDRLADAGGAGFASKLVVDSAGVITNELVNADGQVVTGAYDLVPILEAFIQTHPDFSYKGARAILAVSGYDGLFGYRTTPTNQIFARDFIQAETESARKVAQALRDAGYEIACYTYDNVAYGNLTAEQIQADLDKWTAEVSPILGVVRTLVYARSSDIAGRGADYTGDKYAVLQNAGFTHFIGTTSGGNPWLTVKDGYVRLGRIHVNRSNLTNKGSWFTGLFDPSLVLNSTSETNPSE